MLTPNFRAAAMASCVFTTVSTQTRTSGGCSDREAKDATVIPYALPSCSVVTTVTPLAKCAIAALNPASSIGIERCSLADPLTFCSGRRIGFRRAP